MTIKQFKHLFTPGTVFKFKNTLTPFKVLICNEKEIKIIMVSSYNLNIEDGIELNLSFNTKIDDIEFL